MEYGKKVSFVHPKAEILSAQGSDIIEKLEVISQFHYCNRQGSFREKVSSFSNRKYGKVEGFQFISLGPEAPKWEHKAT